MVTRSEPGYAWDFCGGYLAIDFTNAVARRVDAVLLPMLRAEIQELTSKEITRVRPWAHSSCAWLFKDTTRKRTRRWCEMKICRNRDTVRRLRTQRLCNSRTRRL